MGSTQLPIILNKIIGYYATIFLSFQQKEISGFLTILWQNDPFKAKWSILAKSYSLIRDHQGKANSPLDKFLAINGPLIGVIEPACYLEALSWEVTVDENGQTLLRRYGSSIDEHLFITNVSVNDLIRNSHDHGYFTGDLKKVLLAENEAVMTMAASVQPTGSAQNPTAGQLESHDAESAACTNIEGSSKERNQVPTTIVIDDDKSDSAMALDTNEAGSKKSTAEDNHDIPDDSNAVLVANAPPTAISSTVMTATAINQVPDATNLGPSSISQIDAGITEAESRHKFIVNDPDASRLSASAFSLDGEYPFNTEFDPNLSGETFNPFMGNQFNVFDMSDASWDDFIDFDASV